jgi:predicted amidohydrolase
MKIAIAQSLVTLDPRANGKVIRAQIRQAAENGCRLIQIPEGAMSGYPSGTANKQALAGWKVDWSALREELEPTRTLARELKLCAIVGANVPLTPPARPHNSLYVISDTGELVDRYDKRLISFSEINDWYTLGINPVVFEVDGFRFGCSLCIEIQFTELFVEYVGLGVGTVLLSSFSRDEMFAVQAQGHAACGAFWLSFAVPAQCSDAASSGIVGPDDRWLARAAADGQSALVFAELDRSSKDLHVALNHARPWRARARSGTLHTSARVSDRRSDERTKF